MWINNTYVSTEICKKLNKIISMHIFATSLLQYNMISWRYFKWLIG